MCATQTTIEPETMVQGNKTTFFVSKDKFVKDEEEMKKSGKIELVNESDSFEIAGIARDVAE
ncbi:MAG: hypothetical protein WCJ49_05710 [Deltaproteobacteria bacterium]